jgi:hypothetical protein
MLRAGRVFPAKINKQMLTASPQGGDKNDTKTTNHLGYWRINANHAGRPTAGNAVYSSG